MQNFRDVDRTTKWMNQAVKEEMIVPAMSQAIIGEIEAQAAHIAHLGSIITTKSREITALETSVEELSEDLGMKEERIKRMEEVIDTLGVKAKVIQLLKESF